MPIFMIVPTDDAEPIAKALASHHAQGTLDFTKMPKNGFFVQYSGTTQELSNLLGITDGSSASAVVAAISSYYGRAPTTMWEWLKTRWNA